MKYRNSNIELLRIIAMLLIVMDHYASHGLWGLGSELPYALNRYIAGCMMTGKFGVVAFVLISGYYMCGSRFTGRKLARIYGEVAFYSVVFWTIFYIVRLAGGDAWMSETLHVHAGLEDLLHSILPIGYQQYWFVTDYVVLMVVSPYLNQLLNILSKGQLLSVLAVSTVFWSIIPTFTHAEYAYTEMIWWFVLYLYAGYIRRYVDRTGNGWKNIVLGILALGMYMASVVVTIYLGHAVNSNSMIENSSFLRLTNSPLTLLFGTQMLIGLAKLPIHSNKRINIIASATFGVYLIHNNRYVMPFLWKYVLGLPTTVYDTPYLIPHMVLSVSVVFAICVVIDLVRQKTVERWYMQVVEHIYPGSAAICHRVAYITTRILERIMQ